MHALAFRFCLFDLTFHGWCSVQIQERYSSRRGGRLSSTGCRVSVQDMQLGQRWSLKVRPRQPTGRVVGGSISCLAKHNISKPRPSHLWRGRAHRRKQLCWGLRAQRTPAAEQRSLNERAGRRAQRGCPSLEERAHLRGPDC